VVNIFDDQWGDVGSIICFTGSYWYCEAPPPRENPGIGDFQSLGCYSDSEANRGLSNMITDWAGMTAARCLEIAKDYKFAGLEYYA
jgi:hypothetical protein